MSEVLYGQEAAVMPSGRIPKEFCVRCKGARNLCGLGYCPILVSLKSSVRSFMSLKGREVDGASPPTAVVGESGYPRVNVYLGVPPGVHGAEAKLYDSPTEWHLRLGLKDIIGLRSRLVHASVRVDVRKPEVLYEKEVGLAGLSESPVDVEARLRRPPKLVVTFSPILPPSGPSAPAERVRITDNPRLHPELEKLLWDDVKAGEAAWTLYRGGVDFHIIVRALTLGFLGRRRGRRAVPTRWGITAVDSMISSRMLRNIRAMGTVNNVLVFHASYLHNKYTVVVAPGRYSTSWVEVWRPNSLWNPGSVPTAFEVRDDFKGNLSVMDGGFIAARTPVLEYLRSIGRQARVMILREVEPGYIYPIGSWQIRLTVKHALLSGALMKNPTRRELAEFLMSRHSVPAEVIEKVVSKVFTPQGRSLYEYVRS